MLKRFKSSRLYKYLFVLILIIGTFFVTAKSSWNLDDGKIGLGSIFNSEYVCFNKNKDIKYYRVEDALDKANSGDTIYCYPGKNPTIRRDCTIANNVTLILPYEGETWNGRKSGDKYDTGNSTNNFADSDNNKVGAYKKNELTIANNVTLSIEGGKLYIGGVVGHESSGLSGHTSGNYTQISLETNAKIIAKEGYNNEIECLGYIKEKYSGNNKTNNSQVIFESGTTVKLPFVIYDYQGGDRTVGSYKKGNISPFAIFDFPNIQVESKINYGTNIIGLADLFTNKTTISLITIKAQHNTTDINIVGTSSSLVNLKENSYIIYKYIHSDLRYTTNDANSYSKIDFYGGMDTGNLKMEIKLLGMSQTISTEDVLFPLSYRLNLNFYSGIYNINTKCKLMTGSNLYSDHSSTMNFNKDFIIYKSYSDPDGTPKYPTKDRARFIINGKTTNDKETMYLNISSKTLSVTSIEGHWKYTNSDKIEYNDSQPDLTQVARGEVLSSDKETHPVTNFESTIYTSSNYSYFVKANDLGSYTIKYYNDDKTLYKEVSYPIFKGETISLNGLSIEEPTKRFYEFEGWKITSNSDLTTNLKDPNGFEVKENNTYYAIASYSLATYSISFNYEFLDCKESELVNDNNVLSFTKNDLPLTLKKASNKGTYFNGWYINKDYNNSYLIIDESINDVGYKDLELTCQFTNSKTYTIKFIDNTYSDKYSSGALNTQKVSNINDINIPYPINCNENPNFNMYFEGFYDQNGNKLDENYVFNDQDDVIIFTAKWTNKDVLTYLDNNGKEILKEYYKKGSQVTLKGINEFDNSDYTNPKDETSGADKHTYYTLSGYSTTKNGSKVYDLGSDISNFSSMNLYPYYEYYSTYLLECNIDASNLINDDGKYDIKFNNTTLTLEGNNKTTNYLSNDTIIEVKIYKLSYGILSTKYFNWSITGVTNFLEGTSSGNTSEEHTIKFKMPKGKVTINMTK